MLNKLMSLQKQPTIRSQFCDQGQQDQLEQLNSN